MVLISAALTAKDCPTEGKLILSLLGAKVHGKSLPDDAITTVHECDLYGDKNPWEIWEAFGGGDNRNNNGSRELYIFSTIKKESSRLVRTIGLGSWEPHGKDVSILAQGGSQGAYQRVAVRKCLRFDNSGTHHDGAWIMHEFSLDPSFLNTPSANFNYVLCKLVKNEGNPIRFIRISTEEITRQEVTNNRPASTDNNGGLSPLESENVQVQVEGGDDDMKIKVQEETTAQEEERPIKSENGKLPQMVGDKKNKVEEATDDDDYEEHIVDNLSWPQFFSTQLIESNDKGAVKQEEEYIELLPNRFARDLLLPRLNTKYFGIMQEIFGKPLEVGGDNNTTNGLREIYFSTTINMKSSRTIGLGSWEDQHNDVIIVAKGTNERVAVKKCLRFDKSGTNHDGAWIMHEYSLDSSLISTPSANYNYVLCKLIKNRGRERITRQEVTNRPRNRLSTSLARAAASTNNNGGLTPIKSENRKLPPMVGDKKTKVEETTDDDYEEHVDDNLSWPQFLSKQLIKSNKGAVKQEEEAMELLPNPFARDCC